MIDTVSGFFTEAEYQDSPLRALTDFLKEEKSNENAKKYEAMRFVGYVLDIGFNDATIITSDPFKQAVGGVPRGSFLIMAPSTNGGMPPHFSLLRVTDTAPTPLSKEVQQTYFELHKKSDEKYKLLWVNKFPLFDIDSETEFLTAKHNPTAAPLENDVNLIESDP